MDIKNYSIQELEELCSQIRKRILEVVSKNGGHLSSTLGAVELIVAMHYVFDSKRDPFIFDVSHQAYAHKLLTDRWDKFDTLRQFGGISGYTKPSESQYDYYVAGHSSTSLSLAVGAAKSIKLKNEDRIPVVLIGDGAMSAGMVYEAMNELGDKKYPVVIILNDNEMSISKPIGAISKYLSQKMASPFYQNIKKRTEKLLSHLPDSATYLAKRFEESLRLITPGILFEELGIEYIGPIDGHDLEGLIETYKIAKDLNKPVIIHAQTLKGKGYKIAEGYYEHWHGVGPFDIKTGKPLKKSNKPSATLLFSNALMDIAKKDEKVVGVTAAMPSGTGLKPLIEEFPDRFWDVGIAEQHAVTSMGPLAKEGFKPFVAIYSTFLQRGYDQVIHDIALMNVPVVFAIDRAGIVGEDGETHQGAFDISYLRAIPNITLFAPRDTKSMKRAVEFAYSFKTPCAFRYPRGSFILDAIFEDTPFELGKSQMLIEDEGEVLFIGYGNGVGRAYETIKLLDFKISLIDLRFVKPLDEEKLTELTRKYKKWFVFSDSVKMGGVASAISEFLFEHGINDVDLTSFEFEDRFLPHGKTEDVERYLGIRPEQIANKIKEEIQG
ncbi:1-deoxy-D-xylulose-5-phosphate synthase [Nitrosophilus labii]|uniref:1-deoxy-D-xylulose-5-phosphate synthase n=1 Tax=Nitrosophilus labii TaxID=2706014 RepID=UPI0016573EC4|nr:1-deoxy-D-xylulose-5-phosphate synthase [Nitrosophilus labii]